MTPAMHRFLYILFLFAFLDASAQQMPERREVRKGNRSYHKGDYQKAVERYTQALTYAPGSFEGTYNHGPRRGRYAPHGRGARPSVL